MLDKPVVTAIILIAAAVIAQPAAASQNQWGSSLPSLSNNGYELAGTSGPTLINHRAHGKRIIIVPSYRGRAIIKNRRHFQGHSYPRVHRHHGHRSPHVGGHRSKKKVIVPRRHALKKKLLKPQARFKHWRFH